MNYDRALNFIFFGFIGNDDYIPKNVIKKNRLELYIKILQLEETDYNKLTKEQAFNALAIDLLYRSCISISHSEANPHSWPIRLDYIGLMASTKKPELLKTTNDRYFDIQQIEVICMQYEHRYSKDVCKKEGTYRFHEALIERCYAYDETKFDDNKRMNIFIKGFIELINYELNKNSQLIDWVENDDDRSIYLIKKIALNLLEFIGGERFFKETRVNINVNKDGMRSFFSSVVINSLFSSSIYHVARRLQTFIDLFIFGSILDLDEVVARKKYVEWVIITTLKSYIAPNMSRFEKRVTTLATDKKDFLAYLSRNHFSSFNKKFWYDELYDIAVKKEKYVEFTMLMLALLPNSKQIDEILNKSSSSKTSRNNPDKSGKTKALNVKINSLVFNTLDQYCYDENEIKKEFVTKAIVHELEYQKYRKEFFSKQRNKLTGVRTDDDALATKEPNDSISYRESKRTRDNSNHIKPMRAWGNKEHKTTDLDKSDVAGEEVTNLLGGFKKEGK